MNLDFEDIKSLIPQRFPFIMIDRIIELEPDKRAVSIKNISGNDIFFLGHFPEKAILPGAAIIEAMAQTAIVLFSANKVKGDATENRLYFFGSVKARFLKPVVPGDQLKITVISVKSLATTVYVSAEASVDGVKVSEADLVFSVKQ